jgi:predicted NUDIX family NTP pyrophosphohydrolase
MTRTSNVSAGILLFRQGKEGLEVFLGHPGGPFWRNRDDGAWTIPKGILEPGEEPFRCAVREFREETGIELSGPYVELGSIRQKAGKVVHAWAVEGDADEASITSNQARLEWPRGSGRWITYPEVDRCGWFSPEEARRKLIPAQAELVERLERLLAEVPEP